jgi:hypothetical protein
LPGEPATGADRGASTGADRGFSTGADRGFSTDADRGASTDADRGFSTGAGRGFSTGAGGGFSTGSALRSTETARSGSDDEGTAGTIPGRSIGCRSTVEEAICFAVTSLGAAAGGSARKPSHTPPTMSSTRIPTNQE